MSEAKPIDGFCEVSWDESEEEVYDYWGKCLGCGFSDISREAKFCGGCGKVIGNRKETED